MKKTTKLTILHNNDIHGDFIEEKIDIILSKNRLVAISYGPFLGCVKEFETKLVETTKFYVEGHEMEQYMHGPYLGLKSTDYIFYMGANDELTKRLLKLKKFTDQYATSEFIKLGHDLFQDIKIKDINKAKLIGIKKPPP